MINILCLSGLASPFSLSTDHDRRQQGLRLNHLPRAMQKTEPKDPDGRTPSAFFGLDFYSHLTAVPEPGAFFGPVPGACTWSGGGDYLSAQKEVCAWVANL